MSSISAKGHKPYTIHKAIRRNCNVHHLSIGNVKVLYDAIWRIMLVQFACFDVKFVSSSRCELLNYSEYVSISRLSKLVHIRKLIK